MSDGLRHPNDGKSDELESIVRDLAAAKLFDPPTFNDVRQRAKAWVNNHPTDGNPE